MQVKLFVLASVSTLGCKMLSNHRADQDWVGTITTGAQPVPAVSTTPRPKRLV